jgi:hypothetical protein
VARVEFAAEQPSSLGPGVAVVSDVNTDASTPRHRRPRTRTAGLDVVVAREGGQPARKHTDVLLMNLQGVLTDQTAIYATRRTCRATSASLTPWRPHRGEATGTSIWTVGWT